MEKSRIAQFTAYFQSDSTAVWNAMTDHTDFSWRSDLTRINTVSDREFIEIFKNGNETRFLITEKEPCRKYAFHMEHTLFTGEWSGVFTDLPDRRTKVVLTERLCFKNPAIYLLSFFAMNLKSMQKRYIRDLKKKLGEPGNGDINGNQ